jgi:hypothetical protein
MEWQLIDIDKLVENPNNPRTIEQGKFDLLVTSIKTFPKMLELRPLVVNKDFMLLGGNMRLKACKALGLKQVPAVYAEDLTPEEEKEFVIKDNVSFGEWDWDILANEWEVDELEGWGMDVYFPSDKPSTEAEEAVAREKLTETFLVPPFTVLDTRQGYWTERKRAWRKLIKDFGESREGTLAEDSIMSDINSGVSILDPVLAELVNLWFGVKGGKTFDCFAGDTVFGYVSAYLGNSFTGIELRKEQADLNNERTAEIDAEYICDDGQNVGAHIMPESQDLLFSCPPYFDLEVYSNLPNDASNQKEYKGFLKILDNAFSNACKCLKNDRFAVITVGDLRDKKGAYYRFPDHIKDIFTKNGLILYNEVILVETLGTLPQRVRRSMTNRKLGKCHQNVLVFYKGDPKNIGKNFGELELSNLEEYGEDN